MRRILQIKVYHNQKNRIIVPKNEYFLIKDITSIQLGFNKVPCEVLSHKQNLNTIYVSSSIGKQLNIRDQAQIIIYPQDNSCIFYYLFGVFLHRELNYSKYQNLYQMMARIGETLGFGVFLFSSKQINYDSQTVNGYLLRQSEWDMIEISVPSLIYNRIPNRVIENHPQVIKAKNYLSATSIIFNSDFLHKWQVYDQLKKSNEFNYLLPEVVLRPSLETIDQSLADHPIYLKPLHDITKGAIYYLEKVDDLIFMTSYPNMIRRYSEDLKALYYEYFPYVCDQYFLEDAIQHKEVNERAFHFRIHTLKNNNDWNVGLYYAKEHPLSSNSNIPNILSMNSLFEKNEAFLIARKISHIATQLSHIIENNINGTYRELGFDIALDQENRLWIEEVYSKPSWEVFNDPQMTTQAQEYFTQLMEWSITVAKDLE
ncbi:hypothetical protein JCM21714_3835 [Gracilibacillus boraciitolerans JCM 21714]|uniref:ATP-grasp domain-containing protein n=1 Tax=Gracilibacillus boraciitolerans JCM 21714 TaxID=1298598 RepID=W4VN88_9BACI|nr:YheC/YheD family protein [Gracilibacillus boraciitolerans]GAE94657.1 hypothetical protein JCM21714_3835 [Gracilibacillus boraciitolerans JCM 21714]